jgi:hypothetical protein
MSPKQDVEEVVQTKEPVVYDSIDALKKGLKENAQMRNELLETADDKLPEFYAKYLKPKAEGSEQAAPTKEKQAKAPVAEAKKSDDDDEIEIKTKVKKSVFGTYINGRKPEEAIVEMGKGNEEKDKTIRFLKEKLGTVETDLNREKATGASFKKELEEWKRKKEEAARAVPAKTRTEIKLPENIDNLDMLDPESQKKLAVTLKQFQQVVEELRQENNSLREEIGEAKVSATSVRDELKTRDNLERTANQTNTMLDEIDEVRSKNSDIFKSTRPYEAIELDYVAAVKGMCSIAGVKGELINKDGSFTEEARKVFATYNDETQGKEFREKCEKEGYALPEDFSDLAALSEIRNMKKRVIVNGEIIEAGMPLEDAVSEYKRLHAPDPKKAELEAMKKGADAHARAVNKRGEFAKEARTAESAPPADVSSVTADQVTSMFNAYDASFKRGKPDENIKQKLEQILRSANWPEEEIKARLGG